MPNRFDFSKDTIKAFLENLGSISSTPGGGAAAALTAATGAALIEMTSRINAKRALKKEALVSTEAKKIIAQSSAMKTRFVQLMTLDAQAFAKLSIYFRADKSSVAYQKALKKCAGVPLEICELAVKGLGLAVSEKKRTNQWLASDLAEAAILLETAVKIGRLNVEINLHELADKTFVNKTRKHLDELEKKASALKKDAILVLKK
jgi:methenyltetrahydrofolate cyclohydrolase